jgi:hypothetical protein
LRGSGRLDTRLDTPPISVRHHPLSRIAPFKQGDVTKAIKALARAGVHGRVEIERGRIVVVVTPEEPKKPDSEWD